MAKHGVPKGYKHHWKYKGKWSERKIAPKTWKITFKATKRKRSNSYGGYGKGTKVSWRLHNVKQHVIKTGKGTYQTILTGIKKLAKARIKKPRKYYRNTY